ncbi:MAG: hypothetical protein HY747_00170 [Elusimicrobia bacterium]|nr:hypothetical protein [Elusimicrobiota bacterium]
MGIVVVGSIALDILSLPGLKRRQVTGGSAVYSALSLCPFAPVRLVGVIGDDFPGQVIDLLTQRGVDLEGVEKKSGKTFCWEAEYDRNLSEAKTLY